MIKIKTTLFAVMLCIAASSNAQRHFYHRVDVGSSNIYTFVLSNLATGYTNYFTHDILFDNSYIYTIYGGKISDESVKTKAFSPMGVTVPELFNDAFAGVKLGYQSDMMGTFNWGMYVSGHFRTNQYKAEFAGMDSFTKEQFNYLKPGIGLLLTIGSIESKVKVQLEAAARYDFPIGYKGAFGTSATNALEKGMSSHYSVKIAGYSWFSAGVFADVCHYSLYKNIDGDNSFKPYSFGVTFTITPKRGEDIYD